MTDSQKLDLLISEIRSIKSDMQRVNQKITSVELHIEIVTDKNIQKYINKRV